MVNFLTGIFRAKTRSLLAMAGIAVGAFAVSVISTIGAAGTQQVGAAMDSMGIDTLLIRPADNVAGAVLSERELDFVRETDGVFEAMPLESSVSEVKILSRRLESYIWGVDKSAGSLISLEAIHGRLICGADVSQRARVCVIDEKFALESYGRSNIVGKKINVLLGGRYCEFEVVGVARSGLSPLQGMLSNIVPDFVYIPITTMQLLTGRTTYDKIAVRLSGESPNAPEDIIERLEKYRGCPDGYVCNNLLAQKSQLDGIMDTVTAALSLVAGISLVVAGISVMTTMMMSVSERRREIGVKKALGAKNSDICTEFLLESVTLTFFGSIAGIAAGLFVSGIGCVIAKIPFSADVPSLVVSAVVSAAIGAVFGAYPAAKAARLDPAEALRV